MTWASAMERVTRIELALSAWEADVLPLNYTRATPVGPVSKRNVTLPHPRPPALKPWGLLCVAGVGRGCGGRELGRTVGVGEEGPGGIGVPPGGSPRPSRNVAFVVR